MKTTMVMMSAMCAMACAACSGAVDPGGGGEPAASVSEETAGDAGARPAIPARGPVAAAPIPQVVDGGAPVIPAGCSPLGGSCATSADCLCGQGAGCEWDNVECRAGTCQLENKCVPDPSFDGGYNCTGDAGPLLPSLDAGYPCCSRCELDYQTGVMSLSQWLSCNDSCKATDGFCPVTCYNADTHL